mmetsp:Transcript_28581/g.77109  ORF Transcript_28581/g.77109 Transcript_28581/m.77109 type:complete len:272 (-) Transcript_28581:284-1099(-)|eukprot:CAMPEP_0202346736 /NCGR_PEP_ID=MMETSP1126-20121109/5395_1 /ASSEMBLY_ACC=CAM_ASM_000457 /TAXON_ID=3047 /ORGANISM="Dunaliella tertiolecta, Strain CCMP1320" /LENGTH=271 /DNA_ID=CAMNT_0048938179 /DNA_START=508 /DNA_END=1323 /DNA_ORIENTATION=-
MNGAKVFVTGGAGRTGSLVVQKLLARRPQFEPIATVRSDTSKASLVQKTSIPESNVVVLDMAQKPEVLTPALEQAMKGCSALIIATSAVPAPQPPAPGAPPGPPVFLWKENQAPEQVDWLAQKAQVDAAKAAGVGHVVIISSMGGCDPNHPLNKIANGNILQWKRKAEQYLIGSGLRFTIVHPGGLKDEKGGERQLLVDVDDKLVKTENRTVPREDVAEVCVQSLLEPAFYNKSFDLTTLPPGQGAPTTDFAALMATLGGKSCDYSINSQM